MTIAPLLLVRIRRDGQALRICMNSLPLESVGSNALHPQRRHGPNLTASRWPRQSHLAWCASFPLRDCRTRLASHRKHPRVVPPFLVPVHLSCFHLGEPGLTLGLCQIHECQYATAQSLRSTYGYVMVFLSTQVRLRMAYTMDLSSPLGAHEEPPQTLSVQGWRLLIPPLCYF
ncbi:uncharacterized protein BCR38DRAFT_80151 [Pseudomassariella vexata]|uniref:Uncharacterized protein n=1 Tax=Pseudomassariella vexata TaxID=1141098 RepID=A0A1Y2DEQ7_9PEZI|nr:uncharacterized protein BCR38DRAFT_80151 [Pseudomassariella vexata]ORY57772.1 hypothetical protein BCR38DRAFT_80151 [Pseudomassariella vexata]